MLQTQKAEAQQKEIFGEIKNDELGFKTLYIYYDFFGEDNGHKFRVPTGATPGWQSSSEITTVEKVTFDASLLVDNVPISSFEYWFEGFTALDKIEGLDNLQKTAVHTMKGMFKGCTSLKDVALSELDISQVTYFDEMFSGCTQLQYVKFNNTTSTNENGNNFSQMFKNCSTLNGIDLRHINLNNPANTSEMFSGCSMLNFIYLSKECDLSSTNTENMFLGCDMLSGHFNVTDNNGNIIGYFEIFPNEPYGILKETTLTLYYDNEKDTKSIGATEVFDLNYNDTPDWYTGTSEINDIIKKVIISENFIGYDPGKHGCDHLFSGFVDLEEITGFEYINTKEVESLKNMFLNCKNIEKLDLIGLETSNVKVMDGLFQNCYKLNQITFGPSFNTEKVNSMESMFRDCPNLEIIDLRQFDVASNDYRTTIDIYMMFDYTGYDGEPENKLKTILVNDGWNNITKNTSLFENGMVFRGNTNLVGENGTKFDESNIGIEYAIIDGYSEQPGYLSDGIYAIKYQNADEKDKYDFSALQQEYKFEDGATINPPNDISFDHWEYVSLTNPKISGSTNTSIVIPKNTHGAYNVTLYWKPTTIGPELETNNITFPNNWRDFCNHLEKTTFLRFTTNGDPEPQSCEITIDGKSKEYPIQQNNSVEIDQLPSLPGEYKCKALFKGESYNKELDFTLTITAVENMIMQLYKNVIFVNNACRRFETYQWYRYNNDEELANGKRQYFTEPTLSGSYYTLINGYIHACPWETPASLKKNSPSVTTYPNPAAEGKPFTIEISDYEPGTEYTLRIYNSSGNIVLKQRVADKTTTISLPQGIYTGAVISNGEKMTFKVIVR